jgi:hypothetical protein
MSQFITDDEVAELPDWLAAVKRREAAATLHPPDDDWPVPIVEDEA